MTRSEYKTEIGKGKVLFDFGVRYVESREGNYTFPIPISDSLYVELKREIEIEKILGEIDE